MQATTKNISSPSKAFISVKLVSQLRELCYVRCWISQLRELSYLCCLIIIFCSCQETKKVDNSSLVTVKSPLSVAGLQNRTFQSTLTFEKKVVGTKNYQSDIWSYSSDSLKIYTLVNTPKIKAPEKGFPILIFGHGFHPEPKKYGVSTKTGEDWRPGDYYRGIPEAYAEKGFVAITPDYRGHNISEGFEYTKTSFLASTYYAIDVLNLIAALPDLKGVNLKEVYYLGHSMGGDVGLKMLLATDKIKAASLWAPVAATTLEQALYYGKFYDELGEKTDIQKMAEYMSKMDVVISDLGFAYDMDQSDPIHFIKDLKTPIIIHHGRTETSVPYMWSESLATKLYKYQKTFEFYAYDSKNHLFQGVNRIEAVERDIAFFENQN